MTNPFLSNPEATAFWREQQQACEEARRLLVKTPEFAQFLAAGGTLAVVPDGFYALDKYVALLKDGDTVYSAVTFFAESGVAYFEAESVRQTVLWVASWLTEARDGVRYVRPEITADDIIAGRVFFAENGAGFTASTVSGDVVYCPELGETLLREDFARAMNAGRATF